MLGSSQLDTIIFQQASFDIIGILQDVSGSELIVSQDISFVGL